jgi:uncharacterized protein (UPF0276 family)
MPRPNAIPARTGVGLKAEHYQDILAARPDIGWFEIHAENYMGAGGPPHFFLERIREIYPVSLHGVGLSIGSHDPLDQAHLERLKALNQRYRPGLFSEHLAWSTHAGVYFNDLLPVPYTEETVQRVVAHVSEVQDTLGRQMLLENPSTYVAFETSTMSEVDFLRAVVKRTGCGLLLDVNNVYVSAVNHGTEPMAYLDAFPMEHVGEIHLGGHFEDRDDLDAPLLIDAHGTPVAEVVWHLYARTLARIGAVPTLIEWDNDVPSFQVLAAEAARAHELMAAEVARRQRQAAYAQAR